MTLPTPGESRHRDGPRAPILRPHTGSYRRQSLGNHKQRRPLRGQRTPRALQARRPVGPGWSRSACKQTATIWNKAGASGRPGRAAAPRVSQPAGSLLYELPAGHLDRQPGELVFLARLGVARACQGRGRRRTCPATASSAQLGRSRGDAAQPLSELERALVFGAVGEEAAGLPARRPAPHFPESGRPPVGCNDPLALGAL